MTNDVDDLCHLTEGIRIFNVTVGTVGFKSVILLFCFLFVPSFLCSHFLIANLLDKLSSLWFHLEEDMVTHYSILSWRIQRTEEPGRL